jgi:Mrp family chromosome partitioning ATPase
MAADNPYRVDILRALGAKTAAGVSNFSGAVELVIFDAGPGTTDAQRLISTLLDSGYPAEKVKYYRGGMQIWTALGLTTQETPS